MINSKIECNLLIANVAISAQSEHGDVMNIDVLVRDDSIINSGVWLWVMCKSFYVTWLRCFPDRYLANIFVSSSSTHLQQISTKSHKIRRIIYCSNALSFSFN